MMVCYFILLIKKAGLLLLKTYNYEVYKSHMDVLYVYGERESHVVVCMTPQTPIYMERERGGCWLTLMGIFKYSILGSIDASDINVGKIPHRL